MSSKLERRQAWDDENDSNSDQGEDLMRPSSAKAGMISADEDDDEEEVDEELTEADIKFIARDDEEEGSQEGSTDDVDDEEETDASKKRRKGKRKKPERGSANQEPDDSELDEDDLALIGLTKKPFKRLRKKGAEQDVSIDRMFEEDEEDEAPQDTSTARNRIVESDEEDFDDFIVEDEEDMDQNRAAATAKQRKEEKARRRRERQELAKNLGLDYGISDDAWRDIQEIFGDGSDYAFALEPVDEDGDPVAKKLTSLQDIFEPSQIAAKMMTDEDKIIRVRDVPERLQQDLPPVDFTGAEEYILDSVLLKEADFITRKLMTDRRLPQQLFDHMITDVKQILQFIRRDFFEVPFIFAHRQDYFSSALTLLDLWQVYDAHILFLALETKRQKAVTLLAELKRVSSVAAVDAYIEETLNNATTLEQISDFQAYIQMHYGSELSNLTVNPASLKRVQRKSPLERALSAGIDGYVQMFNVNIQDFARALVFHQSLHCPADVNGVTPGVAAQPFVCSSYPTVEAVMAAGREVLAHRIAADPQLRGFLRGVYLSDAVVTITPTDKGRKVIDASHPYYHFKYVTERLLSSYAKDPRWLQILAAEAEGLVELQVFVEAEDRLMEDLVKNICNVYVSEIAGLWNAERTIAVTMAAKTLIFPQIIRWLKEKWAQEVTNLVLQSCESALERKLNVAPLRPSLNGHIYEDDVPVVFALSWGDGNRDSVTLGVVLNEDGEVVRRIKLSNFVDSNRYRDDFDLIAEIMTNYAPDAIVLGGFSPSTKLYLLPRLRECIKGVKDIRDNHRADVPIVFVDDDVARLYMNSERAKKDFPDSEASPLLRYIVSLARRVQNPILETAALANPQNEIKHLMLDSYQKYVPFERLKPRLDRAFMNVVTSCGVDINAAVLYPHLSHTLQFVAGLGPRKAHAIISALQLKGGKLESRVNLVLEHKIIGGKVFSNCASFLRIRSYHFRQKYIDSLDVLDDTRIHPEDYEYAQKMAADALELDEGAMDADDNPSIHVKELMESGDFSGLDSLELGDFASQLERSRNVKKQFKLVEIKAELMAPYAEKRRPFEPASSEEVFAMLTGESDETLYRGMMLNVMITRQREGKFAACRIGAGLEGYLRIEDAASGDVPPVNTALEVCVLEKDIEEFTVKLTTKAGLIDQLQKDTPKKVDDFFSRDREEADSAAHVAEKRARVKSTRTIQHPYFHNLDYKAAEEYLRDKPLGEVVIRPSTKGKDHISVTWKISDSIYQHIDVKEDQKDNDWSLGRRLLIDDVVFAEIDQIIAEYIVPMSQLISRLLIHPKYMAMPVDQVDRYLAEQCQRLKRSVYAFTIHSTKPGTFYFVYKHPSSQSAKREYIQIMAGGYMYRARLCSTVDQVLNWFKADETRKAAQAISGNPAMNRPSGPVPNGQFAGIQSVRR